MADVCDDDGVSGESLRRKGAEKLLFSFYQELAAPPLTENVVQAMPIHYRLILVSLR